MPSLKVLIEQGRALLEARPISLDKEELDKVTTTAVEWIRSSLGLLSPSETLGSQIKRGGWQKGVRITNPFTQDVEHVLLTLETQRGPADEVFIGGAYRRGKTPKRVVLYLNARKTAEEALADFNAVGAHNLTKLIRSTFVHELVHVVDPGAALAKTYHDPGEQTPAELKRYLNQPSEYAAFIAQVVDDITSTALLRGRLFRKMLKTPRKRFDKALKSSDTWKDKSRFLSSSNRRKAMATIYRMLEPHLHQREV